MNTLKFWAVFAVGVSAGAAVALIYAPQSGTKTRKQLKRTLDEASEYIKDAGETLGGHAQKAAQRGKEAWEEVSDSAQRAANQAVKAASDLV